MTSAVDETRPRANVLGVEVDVLTIPDAFARIQKWIRSGSQNYVCVTGAHGIIECRKDARLRAIHNAAGMVTADGMPVVWMSRLFGYHRATRVCGPDLMRAVSAATAGAPVRHFYYGGSQGLAERLGAVMRKEYPGLQVVGTFCPPFRPLTPEEDMEVVKAINDAAPDVVWVGLSTPKQEVWMSEHLGRIHAPVVLGVGAAFDFLAGTKKQAPSWMQRSGLEWFYRLATEPRRLWKRYAVIVPSFICLSLAQIARALVPRIPDVALPWGKRTSKTEI
ncbi:WecB/TagA/CpsF family glycosyltransferase [Methylobacterium sp. P31]